MFILPAEDVMLQANCSKTQEILPKTMIDARKTMSLNRVS